MTREETIAMLKSKMDGSVDTSYEWAETVRMAIEALSQPIVAKHFDIQSGYIYCSPQIAENVKVVVRCKDCRHYGSDGGALMVCDVSDMLVDNTDYCSYGERREE